jgi:hypothetical protein
MAACAAPACRGARHEPLVTYFNADHGLSVRYPAGWRSDEAEQDGMWYRYFLGPPTGPQRKPAVSVTLLAGPLAMKLEDYAQSYLAGNNVASSRDETRGSARGKSYMFASPDGATRHSLLLLQEDAKVYGLYSQGEAQPFERQFPLLDEMARSLTLERPATYPEEKDDKFGFAIRIPPSWRETRRFSGGGTLLMQFASPPMGADKNGQTVNGSLTLTVEPTPAGGGLETFYKATRQKQGEAFRIASHAPWRDGYLDVLTSETSITESRMRRYYRVAGGRGYSLSLEAREDVYPRVYRWCDIIAATLRTGSELQQVEQVEQVQRP